MTLRIGRYIITGRVLLKFLFICFLVGLPIGASIAAYEAGKSVKWLPYMALFLVVGYLIKTAITDFKKDNQLD
ncbi:hypothetical protein [Spirosoma sp. KUDC1026]|uniref:hypothetical protein n=1 Tax=Spirosoma sp. KUDC1026 TaxID=2745947 RepID=UPI00159BDAE7|nr:hypothetical protein [Spirosoma sp. KUDC1026]QKZ11765.1 hypothetical protein HU175_03625 [Spirosoma sp. KUDC1026]